MSKSKAVTMLVLLILTVVNLLIVVFGRRDFIFFVFLPLLVLSACFKGEKHAYLGAVFVGIVVFLIHLYLLVFQLISINILLFSANLLLPIPLIYFGYRAWKESK